MGLLRFTKLEHLLTKSTLKSVTSFTKDPIFYSTRILPQRQTTFTDKLHSKITLLVATTPDASLTPFLDQWVRDGHLVRDTQLQRIVRTLRNKKRFSSALEVSEWMNDRRADQSVDSDLAVQLDLIGKVRGVDAAEKFFDELDNHSDKIHGALLNCYVREGLVEKSLSLFNKMKDMGIAGNPLTYNCIMNLYANTGQPERVPEVLSEMKANGVAPDNFSYRLCIKSYRSKSDLTGVEKVLLEMESEPTITMDWTTYSTVANGYIEAGLHERAIHYLQKAEERVNADAIGYNNLITMYASLGDVSQVMRLWHKQEGACRKRINIDYMTMMGSLVKLGELEEAEKIFNDWKSTVVFYDFRVPNVLLIGLTHHGQVDKAEKMLESIIDEGKTPIPNSWSIISSGYITSKNIEKAVQSMKRALELGPKSKGWEPRPALISILLDWLADNGDIEEVEAFVDMLSKVVCMDRGMYHCLLKARVRHGREVDGVLQRMKDDNVDVDEETYAVLGS